jgi:ATP-dependent Clp protease ATP-binding subunit ClpA
MRALVDASDPEYSLVRGVGADGRPQPRALPAALVVDYAGWLAVPSGQAPAFSPPLRLALKLAHQARRGPKPSAPAPRQLYNPIVWLADRAGDLPNALVTAVAVRQTSVDQPLLDDRRDYVQAVLGASFAGYAALDDKGQAEFAEDLAGQAEGLNLRQLRSVGHIAADQGLTTADAASAVLSLRVGVTESPWKQRSLEEDVRHDRCYEVLRQHIFGQDQACRAAANVVNQAVLGLAGATARTNRHRPKGVQLYAGATGTGKTELAKQLAQYVFRSEDALKVIDMSEYREAHQESRLIGSPPGFVGYESGGQLTDYVRQHPFSVILFDEIEKAHPAILDKFLQIVDEGRLTDGQGTTVYFDNCVLIFTSNLGVLAEGPGGRVELCVDPAMGHEQLDRVVRKNIEQHFFQIGRPELLGRIGLGNILVFDFLAPAAAGRIMDGYLANFGAEVEARFGARWTVTSAARAALEPLTRGPEVARFGGRGLRDAIKPLTDQVSRALARHVGLPVAAVTVDAGPAGELTVEVV